MSEVILISPEKLSSLISRAVEAGVGAAIASLHKKTPREMTENEAADYIGIAPVTLRIWRSQKKGPKYHKTGRSVRYSRHDLDLYLKQSEVQTIDSLENGHETFGL